MNLVGIDISINSTGISIYRNDEIILCNITSTKKSYVWIKKTLDHIDYEFINYTHPDVKDYSEKEILKLREYDKVSDIIVNKVFGNIDKTDKTVIAIEGYNYGLQNTSSIIDIVCLSTLIRKKLLENIPNLEQIFIWAPTSIKSKICEKIYGFTLSKKGKKTINKSPDGVTGGKFDKKDVLKSIIDLNVDTKLTEFLKENKDELLSHKLLPKPFDDVLDSLAILLILKDLNL